LNVFARILIYAALLPPASICFLLLLPNTQARIFVSAFSIHQQPAGTSACSLKLLFNQLLLPRRRPSSGVVVIISAHQGT
jgi:hypothetical protein